MTPASASDSAADPGSRGDGAAGESPPNELSLGLLDLLTVILSVYVLAVLFAELAMPLPAEVLSLLQTVDNVICVIFLADFFLRLYWAKNRRKFLAWHWIDFVSSIPNLEVLRVGRALQVIRIVRVLRAVRSVKVILTMIFSNRIRGAATVLVLLALLMVTFSAMGMLVYEVGPGANIRNANDALWWAVTTITSVGYGDKYPVTTPGRIIGTLLMVGGIALAGTFTACVASFLLESERTKSAQMDTLVREVQLLRQEVRDLRQVPPNPGAKPDDV